MSVRPLRRVKGLLSKAVGDAPVVGSSAPALGLVGAQSPRLSMFDNSLALIASKVSTMAFGFIFWLLAARMFLPSEVGLAAGAIAGMMLCTQLALMGIGSSFISFFPKHNQQPKALLNTSFSLIGIGALVVGAAFLLLASRALTELKVVAADPLFVGLFLTMTVLGSIGVLLDQVSTAMGRGDQALMRSIQAGIVIIGQLLIVRFLLDGGTSVALFSTWVAGTASACLLGAAQLRQSSAEYRYRPRIASRLWKKLLAVGLPNHALTLADRAPGLILPIVVTELLSPSANAYWYAVWMMAWVVYMIPVQVGLNLFSETTQRPKQIRELVRHGTRTSLVLGGLAAAGAALLAPLVLSVLGGAYSVAGTTPLRILVIAVIPLALIQSYFAACRATKRLGEAVAVATVSGFMSVGAAAWAGTALGLRGIALAWVATQALVGVWAVFRLRVVATYKETEEVGRSDDVIVADFNRRNNEMGEAAG
jgi:O-antigen/teichoic acid export membrane protein